MLACVVLLTCAVVLRGGVLCCVVLCVLSCVVLGCLVLAYVGLLCVVLCCGMSYRLVLHRVV